jgi:hypothetical protein
MLSPTAKKTKEEIDRFMTSNDINFDSFSTPMSFKSNILIAGKNFKYLFTYLKQLISFVKNIYLILDPKILAQDVLDAIATTKPKINIFASQAIDTSRTQQFGSISPKIYKIYRVDEYNVTITLDNSVGNAWDVEGLFVQVKSAVDGQIVSPTIKTINDKIEVYFHDKISRNYYLLFI